MKRGALLAGVLTTIALSGNAAAQAPAPRPTLDMLLARAGDYVATFVIRFSGVVAEERYDQEFTAPPRGSTRLGTAATASSAAILQDPPASRRLRSDFLLVKAMDGGDWLSFRDVFEIDGTAMRDRDARLEKLFLDSSTSAVERANSIAAESSRYTFGGGTRRLNNPLLALALLQFDYQPRFRFTLRGVDKSVGPDAWTVDYEERARPTLLRNIQAGKPDRDLIAHGRVWIDRTTGRILKTELKAEAYSIVTTFRMDDALEIAVPSRMEERYPFGSGQVAGSATYGRFRRFGVSTEEKID